MNFSLKLFLALSLFSFIQPLRGEEEKPTAGTKVEVPAGPEVIPSGTVKPMDRQKSSAMAKAMAAAGKQQAMMACMQMMQAAQGAKGSDKALMMMMANQACQQGQQMAKSEEENDKGQKQVSQEDVPKQASIKINEQKIPSGTPGEDNTSMAQYQAVQVDETKAEPGAPSVLKPLLPEIDTGKPVAKVEPVATSAPLTEVVEKPSLPKTTPPVIGAGNTTYADGEKKNQAAGEPPNLGPNAAAAAPFTAGTGKSPAEEAKLLKGLAASDEANGTRKKSEPVGSGEGSGGGEGGGGGGNSGGGEKGPDPFEAMLAQLMGGPPPGDEGGRGLNGDAELEPRQDRTKPPNIFEYAKFRFLKLTDQKKVRKGRLSPPVSTVDGKPLIPREKSAEVSLEKAPKLSKR